MGLSLSAAAPELPIAGRGETLLAFARGAIAARLGLPTTARGVAPWLREDGATFVTLTREGALRGCIGSLLPYRALLDDVQANARAAAFDDPRFSPLVPTEWAGLAVEVSLLSPLELLDWMSEEEAVAVLRPGIDGVVLSDGGARGTFLPQVWEHFPEPRAFLAQLRRKAGLSPTHWGPQTRLARYKVEKFVETAEPEAAVPTL